MKKVKERARIHVNIFMMGFFSVAFFITALQGREHRKKGQSVTEMNLEWHRKFNETGEVGDIRGLPQAKEPMNQPKFPKI